MKEKDQERALAMIDEDPGLHGLRHLRAPYLDMEVGGMLYELVRWVRCSLLSSGCTACATCRHRTWTWRQAGCAWGAGGAAAAVQVHGPRRLFHELLFSRYCQLVD